jgi:hypothetical protein
VTVFVTAEAMEDMLSVECRSLIITLGVVLEVVPGGCIYLDHNNTGVSAGRERDSFPSVGFRYCAVNRGWWRGDRALHSRALVWHGAWGGESANVPS